MKSKRFRDGDKVKVHGTSGYAFSDKVLTYSFDLNGGTVDFDGYPVSVCYEGEDPVGAVYHIVPQVWLKPHSKVCKCCGQKIKERN